MELLRSDLARADAGPAAAAQAARAVARFGAELFGRLAGPASGSGSASGSANLICSPYSVALALGMAVQGARGTTAREILDVLHSPDASALAEGLNGLDAALAARSIDVADPGEAAARQVVLASANSLWGQQGVAWQRPFLDVLAGDFGTGLRLVDYIAAVEAARAMINDWVSEQTRARIPALVPAGVLDQDTRLVLANALYLKAPWRNPFEVTATRAAPFHRLDSSTVQVQLMRAATAADRLAAGPGWIAADLPYLGGLLAMAVVVPEPGRFAEIESSLSGRWLSALLAEFRPAPVEIGLPRWTARTQAGLGDVLAALGMPTAFGFEADFSGMTTQDRLCISAVLHEGFIAVDEAGTEAAAATAVVARRLSMLAPGTPVIADRPFLYVIHDRPTGTPLFIGHVLDPTAT